MTKKFWSSLFMLAVFALSLAPAALCCGLGGVKNDKAADPDDETAMTEVETSSKLA